MNTLNDVVVGRNKEQLLLREALRSKESELIAVLGRRRVGKTYLVKQTYKKELDFEIAGTENATTEFQLQAFSFRLSQYTGKAPEKYGNWLSAFFALIKYLEELSTDRKRVLFFDELPWLATVRSDFLNAFSFFWNNWAINNDVVVVICGSAASWMIKHVIKHRGGLHNRITYKIQLSPFSLTETRAYLTSRGIPMNELQVLRLYMVMGGIPHYLKQIKPGVSVAQNIDAVCFSEQGLLRDEFTDLYMALFDSPDRHMAIVRSLAEHHYGLSRKVLLQKAGLSNGGGATRVLNELEQSGFIVSQMAYGKNKQQRFYRLIDEYSLFYLRFLEPLRRQGNGTWSDMIDTPVYHGWSGYAFENIGIRHLPQIKKALGISGVRTTNSSYLAQKTDELPGIQIDLLIDRADEVINVCEFKFSANNFALTPGEALKLRDKLAAFQRHTGTRKQLFLTLITPFVADDHARTLDWVEALVTAHDLFVE